jgi:DNA polymerase-3 subunit alpha
VVCVRGRLDLREDEPKLICMELKAPELMVDECQPVHLVLPMRALSDDRIVRLRQLLTDHRGQAPVFLHVGSKIIKLAAEFNVNARAGLLAELRVLLGPGCLLTPG